MLQVRIHTVHPQIGLKTTPGRLEMQSELSHISMESQKPLLQIENSRVELTIDQSQCFADAGLLSFSRFLAHYAQKGQQSVQECIARYAREGYELAAIEKGGKIENIVGSTMNKDFSFVVDAVPKQPPQISWNVSGVHYTYQPLQYSTSANPAELNINYQASQLEIYMEQTGSVDIDFTGGIFDKTA